MPADALLYHFLAKELCAALQGGRIDKVSCPESDVVLLGIRAGGSNHSLVISAGASSRVHLSGGSWENPQSPSSFCMCLRKNILGGAVLGISAEPFERILYIDIAHRDELGVRRNRRLVCEVMGKYANIVLVDGGEDRGVSGGESADAAGSEKFGGGSGGKIIESLRHISFDFAGGRQILPGLRYKPPVESRLSPLDFEGISRINFGEDAFSTVLNDVRGLAPLSAAEAVFLSEKIADNSQVDFLKVLTNPANLCKNDKLLSDNADGLVGAFSELIGTNKFGKSVKTSESDKKDKADKNSADIMTGAQVAAGLSALVSLPLSPCVCDIGGGKTDFFIRPYLSLAAQSLCKNAVFFDSLSLAMDYYFCEKDKKARLAAKSRTLFQVAKSALRRAEKRVADLSARLDECEGLDNDRVFGELITANIYRIGAGSTTLVADNFYDGTEVKIALDPTLSPAQNAQKYFKRYAKKKRTLVASHEQIQKAEADKDAFEGVLHSLDGLESVTELLDIADEMAALGLIKPVKKAKNQRISQPITTEIDGFLVQIGRNNIQNDRLVRAAARTDIWLHTKLVHGSHVIICADSKPVPEDVIAKAAAHAAFYSRGKDAGKVEVDYTLVKHVSKPSGAAAGKVVYTNQRTLVVTPKSPDNI